MDDVETNVAAMQETDTPQTSPQESEATHEEAVESKQDRNWREVRRRQAELERENKAQKELIQGFIQQQMNVAAQPVPNSDALDSVPDADYIPKGDVKRMIDREKEKIKKEAVQDFKQMMEEEEKARFHQRLRAKFTDFDDVVTPETLELFETQEPELADTVAVLKDPYKMGLQTYKYIKALGIVSNAPAHKRTKEVEKRLEQNAKTVPTAQSYDKRPMAQTFKMTEQMKQELWKEMNQYAQQADGVPQL